MFLTRDSAAAAAIVAAGQLKISSLDVTKLNNARTKSIIMVHNNILKVSFLYFRFCKNVIFLNERVFSPAINTKASDF